MGKQVGAEDSQLRQVVEMQVERIRELEEKLSNSSYTGSLTNDRIDDGAKEINGEISTLSCRIEEVEKNLSESEQKKRELEYSVTVLNDLLTEESSKNTILIDNVTSLQSTISEVREKVLTLEEVVTEQREDLESMVRSEAVIVGEVGELRKRAEAAEKTGESSQQGS